MSNQAERLLPKRPPPPAPGSPRQRTSGASHAQSSPTSERRAHSQGSVTSQTSRRDDANSTSKSDLQGRLADYFVIVDHVRTGGSAVRLSYPDEKQGPGYLIPPSLEKFVAVGERSDRPRSHAFGQAHGSASPQLQQSTGAAEDDKRHGNAYRQGSTGTGTGEPLCNIVYTTLTLENGRRLCGVFCPLVLIDGSKGDNGATTTEKITHSATETHVSIGFISSSWCMDQLKQSLLAVQACLRCRDTSKAAAVICLTVGVNLNSVWAAADKTTSIAIKLPSSNLAIRVPTNPSGTSLPPPHGCASLLLRSLSPQLIVRLVVSALLEKRVLLVGSNHTTIYGCAEAVMQLLAPFSYSFVYIPNIPHTLIDLLSAPTPFLMGVHREEFDAARDLCGGGIIVFDLDNDCEFQTEGDALSDPGFNEATAGYMRQEALNGMPVSPGLPPEFSELAAHLVELREASQPIHAVASQPASTGFGQVTFRLDGAASDPLPRFLSRFGETSDPAQPFHTTKLEQMLVDPTARDIFVDTMVRWCFLHTWAQLLSPVPKYLNVLRLLPSLVVKFDESAFFRRGIRTKAREATNTQPFLRHLFSTMAFDALVERLAETTVQHMYETGVRLEPNVPRSGSSAQPSRISSLSSSAKQEDGSKLDVFSVYLSLCSAVEEGTSTHDPVCLFLNLVPSEAEIVQLDALTSTQAGQLQSAIIRVDSIEALKKALLSAPRTIVQLKSQLQASIPKEYIAREGGSKHQTVAHARQGDFMLLQPRATMAQSANESGESRTASTSQSSTAQYEGAVAEINYCIDALSGHEQTAVAWSMARFRLLRRAVHQEHDAFRLARELSTLYRKWRMPMSALFYEVVVGVVQACLSHVDAGATLTKDKECCEVNRVARCLLPIVSGCFRQDQAGQNRHIYHDVAVFDCWSDPSFWSSSFIRNLSERCLVTLSDAAKRIQADNHASVADVIKQLSAGDKSQLAVAEDNFVLKELSTFLFQQVRLNLSETAIAAFVESAALSAGVTRVRVSALLDALPRQVDMHRAHRRRLDNVSEPPLLPQLAAAEVLARSNTSNPFEAPELLPSELLIESFSELYYVFPQGSSSRWCVAKGTAHITNYRFLFVGAMTGSGGLPGSSFEAEGDSLYYGTVPPRTADDEASVGSGSTGYATVHRSQSGASATSGSSPVKVKASVRRAPATLPPEAEEAQSDKGPGHDEAGAEGSSFSSTKHDVDASPSEQVEIDDNMRGVFCIGVPIVSVSKIKTFSVDSGIYAGVSKWSRNGLVIRSNMFKVMRLCAPMELTDSLSMLRETLQRRMVASRRPQETFAAFLNNNAATLPARQSGQVEFSRQAPSTSGKPEDDAGIYVASLWRGSMSRSVKRAPLPRSPTQLRKSMRAVRAKTLLSPAEARRYAREAAATSLSDNVLSLRDSMLAQHVACDEPMLLDVPRRSKTPQSNRSSMYSVDSVSSHKTAGSWRLSVANKRYGVCRNYPPVLPVPSSVNDAQLAGTAQHFTSNRLPVLSWRDPETGSSMLISAAPRDTLTEIHPFLHAVESVAQPSTRSSRASSTRIRHGSPDSLSFANQRLSTVGISFDPQVFLARMSASQAAKTGNAAASLATKCVMVTRGPLGKPSDEAYQLPHGWQHVDIDADGPGRRIDLSLSALSRSFDALLSCSRHFSDNSMMSSVESTGWIQQVASLLHWASVIADLADYHDATVIVAIDDGRDRALQLASLAQLLLDPMARTIEGFIQLVQVNWLAFGHPFATRAGLQKQSATWSMSDIKTTNQPTNQRRSDDVAPTFLQFLDAVMQLTHQHPTSFEFNAHMLACMAYHATAFRFSTFTSDCERDRDGQSDAANCLFEWLRSCHARTPQFYNFFYTPGIHGSIRPTSGQNGLRVWSEVYFPEACVPADRFEASQPYSPSDSQHAAISARIETAMDAINTQSATGGAVDVEFHLGLHGPSAQPHQPSWHAIWTQARTKHDRKAPAFPQKTRSQLLEPQFHRIMAPTVKKIIGDTSSRPHLIRQHRFKQQVHTGRACDVCEAKIWGLLGYVCLDCGISCHERCKLLVSPDCHSAQASAVSDPAEQEGLYQPLPITAAGQAGHNTEQQERQDETITEPTSADEADTERRPSRVGKSCFFSNLSTYADAVTSKAHGGYLLKLGNIVRKWKRRWFFYDPATQAIHYFEPPRDAVYKGTINLTKVFILKWTSPTDNAGLQIMLCMKNRTYYLRAESVSDWVGWVQLLAECVPVDKAHELSEICHRHQERPSMATNNAFSLSQPDAVAREAGEKRGDPDSDTSSDDEGDYDVVDAEDAAGDL